MWGLGATLESRHVGFSLRWLLLVRSMGSRTRVQLPRGMWNPPEPKTEVVSPALAGRLLTTGTPGCLGLLLFIVES